MQYVDNVWQDCCDEGPKVCVCFPVRSTFTLQRDFCQGLSVNLFQVSVSVKILSVNTSVDLTNILAEDVHLLNLKAVQCVKAFNVMLELAFYPAVALMYFFGVMKAAQDDRMELNDQASMNVFCLFVLVQPLCLVLGGYTGMATYLLTALVSYNFLPWRKTKQPAKGSKKKAK